MYIDAHVHCRDEEQSDKETIEHALHVAEDSGLSAIFDIGNTDNPVTTRQRYLERRDLALAVDSPVFFGVYLLLTGDGEQIREAVETWREFGPHETFSSRNKEYFRKTFVAGLKEFAGYSRHPQ